MFSLSTVSTLTGNGQQPKYISVEVEKNETSITPDNTYDSICEEDQTTVIPDNTYDSMYEDTQTTIANDTTYDNI